jgi:hypothetical protein
MLQVFLEVFCDLQPGFRQQPKILSGMVDAKEAFTIAVGKVGW